MSTFFVCQKHGEIGKVAVGCGGSPSELADIVHIRAADKSINVCALCYLEFIRQNIGELETRSSEE